MNAEDRAAVTRVNELLRRGLIKPRLPVMHVCCDGMKSEHRLNTYYPATRLAEELHNAASETSA